MNNTIDTTMTQMSQAFERDGFLIVPHLYTSSEVTAFKDEIRRVLDDVRDEAISRGQDPQDLLRHGVHVGLAAASEVFRAAVRDARLLDILVATMGPNVEFISDKVVFKDAETSYASPWHQDWPYWEGCHKVSVWVALDDATVANGTLRVLPGSHKSKRQHHDPGGGLGFSNRVRPEEVDEEQAVTAAVEAGGAVFFHDLTLHGSHASTVAQDRWVWIPTYRDAVQGAHDPDYPWAEAAAVLRGSAG